MKRDFIGNGKNVPQVRWPQEARIAISIVVNYEEGSEHSLLDGDQYHETNGEVPSPVPPEQRTATGRTARWRVQVAFDAEGN